MNSIKNKKPKIALVVDAYNWCFWNIAKKVEKNLSYKYNFEILVTLNYQSMYELFFYLKNFDLVHFFWREPLSLINNENDENFLYKYGFTYDFFKKEILENLYITTSVYDHLYLENDIYNTKKIMNFVKKYTVSSQILYDIYKKLNLNKPIIKITDGIDLDKFYCINKNKYNDISKREIVFGWVGNSAWNGTADDHKGFNTIIKPVLEELKNEGYPINTYYADRQERQIPFEQMNNYYNSIDVLICASKNEGTPNPVLEAMATGTAIISTNVGIVSETFGPLQKKLILKERSKSALKEMIITLLNNLDNLKNLKKENLKYIKFWDWKIKTKEFENFFDTCLNEKK